MPRGRKPRAEHRAEGRIEVRLTLAELRQVREMADRHDCSIADMVRMALLDTNIELNEPTAAILVKGQDLIDRVVNRELARRRIVAGRNKSQAADLGQWRDGELVARENS